MVINFKIIFSLLSNIFIFLACVQAIPIIYAFATITKGSAEFLLSAISLLIFGLIIKHLCRNIKNKRMNIKDMFLFTSLVWVFSIIFSAIPINLILNVDMTTACYETAAAVTTTGSSVIGNLELIPPSILLWRSILQYLGGIGFIGVAIAILPSLNVGGMKLFQTESSEQNIDNVTPKAKNLAIGILLLYVFFTILAIITYSLLGMSGFDAFNHALTSIATGGMSTHQNSINDFSKPIHWAIALFMFIGSLPFAIMAICVRTHKLSILWQDQQIRGYIYITLFVIGAYGLSLLVQENYSLQDAIRIAFFNTINVLSSCGFSLDDYTNKNDFISLLFCIILPLGACSGSTSSGLKIFRLQIAYTLFKRQIKQLMHPYAIFPQRYNGSTVNDTIIRSIITFFMSYLILTIISAILLSLSGISMLDSISITFACLSNIGPGFTETFGPNGDFSILTDFQKLILIFDMVAGRLEILTMLICFFPSFWKI